MSFLQSHTFTVVDIYSVLTVLGQIIALILCGVLIRERMKKSEIALGKWVRAHGLLLMFIVALLATCGSLFYSEIAQWTPCKDCWLQRIFMYPQVILLAIALIRKDKNIAWYILALCVIGAIFSIDHYSDQVEAALHPVPKENGVNELLKPCDATGVSCASTQIKFAFGYITIPMMALTAFLLNLLGSVFLLHTGKPSRGFRFFSFRK